MKTLTHILDAAKRFAAAGRALKSMDTSARTRWARYCIDHGLSFRTYTLGYELLMGADCIDQGSIWLQRGFAALAEHVGKL